VSGLGLMAAVLAFMVLPPLRAHLVRGARHFALTRLMRPNVALTLLMAAFLMSSMFVLIPNISPFVLQNLHYPRERLPLLYAVGGVASFATVRVAGRLTDALGASGVGVFATFATMLTMYIGFHGAEPSVPILLVFVLFMMSTGMRNVAFNTVASKVPAPEERAGFGSIQSAVQHAFCAVGAFLSSKLLSATPSGELVGMSRVVEVSIAIGLGFPMLLVVLDRRVRQSAR
jgi:predicted MFS family arabinose efflux permease